MGGADAGKKHPQIIIHLRHRTNGTPRILADLLLLNGNGRAEAADIIRLGLFHLAQKLAGVGGKALYIASLPLGIERIEHQGRLAGTGHSGYDGDLARREFAADALEIVRTRAYDLDGFLQRRVLSLLTQACIARCRCSP